jgi:hypothetical protein
MRGEAGKELAVARCRAIESRREDGPALQFTMRASLTRDAARKRFILSQLM